MIYLRTGDGRIVNLTQIERFTIVPKTASGSVPRRATDIERFEIVGKWLRSGSNVTVVITKTKKEARQAMTDITNILTQGGALVLDYSEAFPDVCDRRG